MWSPTFINFNENLASEFVSHACRNTACGCQCTPDVVFWLKLVSVLGLKNSWSFDKPASQTYAGGKSTSFCCLPTQIRDICFHSMEIHPKFSQMLHGCRLCSSMNCSAMQSPSQWTCSYGTSKGLHIQLNVLVQLWERIFLSTSKGCSKVLKKKFDECCAKKFATLLQTPPYCWFF